MAVGLDGLDRANDVHSARDVSEDGVLTVLRVGGWGGWGVGWGGGGKATGGGG